jgi:hypothetical protein
VRSILDKLTLAIVLSTSVAHAQPLDVKEPPFSGDLSWLNGSNRQPGSLLKLNVVTLSVYVDTYFMLQFHNPIDHTAFPSAAAPRHNEIGLNLASIGVTLPANAIDTPAGGPTGELTLQYGALTQTVQAQDTTTQRGFFLAQPGFAPIRTAIAGWHFHWLHGANVEVGILPSFVGIESYLTQENWNYMHSFSADFTPYYFSGARVQVYPTKTFKAELWAINGWQTFGQWHEAGGLGYSLTYRPSDRLSLSNGGYVGPETPADESILRFYNDTSAQFLLHRKKSGLVRSVALSGQIDAGYETPGQKNNPPGSSRLGGVLGGRIEWPLGISTAIRADTFWDEGQALLPAFPIGSKYSRPFGGRPFLGTGLAATLDVLPSPWLLVRVEYMHRGANIPLFSGREGITGPNGMLPKDDAAAASFTPDLRRVDDRAMLALILRL